MTQISDWFLTDTECQALLAGADLQYNPDDVAFPRERDPSGRGAHEPGAKLDRGKQIAGDLITAFPRALSAVMDVSTHGAAKYSRHGFLAVPDFERRYLDACMRHLLKHGAGEECDPDSGLSHLSHAVCNLLAIIEMNAREAA